LNPVSFTYLCYVSWRFSLPSYVTDTYVHGLSTNKVVCVKRMLNTYGLKLSVLDSFSE